ncbi:MAG: hypothetical protein M3313_08575 [Actinomycetota bacterium]|nr:hypothetical protein [Actinomycetota bacterium]
MTYPPETPSSTYGSGQPSSYPTTEPASTYSSTESGYPIATDPSGSGYGSDSSTTQVAKDQASQVGGTAAQAGQQVAGVAKEQVANVAQQTKYETKNLMGQTRSELSSQAGTQQQRVAGGMRSLGSELQSMASNSDSDGPAASIARQAADRINSAAGWLEDRDPGQVMTEVQRFARQRPGAFLAIAAVAGLAVGRLTRGLTADSEQSSSYQTGLSGQATGADYAAAQPDNGWQAAAATTAPDPATAYGSGYGTGYTTGQAYDAPAQAPGGWTQDPTPPVGGSEYYDPGAGTVGR